MNYNYNNLNKCLNIDVDESTRYIFCFDYEGNSCDLIKRNIGHYYQRAQILNINQNVNQITDTNICKMINDLLQQFSNLAENIFIMLTPAQFKSAQLILNIIKTQL